MRDLIRGILVPTLLTMIVSSLWYLGWASDRLERPQTLAVDPELVRRAMAAGATDEAPSAGIIRRSESGAARTG